MPKEIGDLVEKQLLFKIEAKNDVNSNFEKSFRVKKLCGDLDIIKKFKYVAVEKVSILLPFVNYFTYLNQYVLLSDFHNL